MAAKESQPNQQNDAQLADQKEAILTFTEKNRQHWTKFVSHYTEEQWQKDMINDMTALVLSNINWLGVSFRDPSLSFESSEPSPQFRVLDYACGPGTMTNALDSHATEYVGVDLSEGMVQAYNTRFQPDASDSQNFKAHAVVGNLLEEQPPAHLSVPKFFNFDLAVVGMGFHHFDNVQRAACRLAERLRAGGILMIIDFVTYHSLDESYDHIISHHGFSEEGIKTLFGNAGLVNIDVKVADKDWTIKKQQRRAFMAKGTKPESSNL